MSDWEFIFDGVFGFLTSPLWRVPMISFIEAQSVVFELSEENHLAWTDIHNKYKSLIDRLTGDFLKDFGISEEQFLQVCVSPSSQRAPEMKFVLLQLLAGDDFEVFKKMMADKNVELQLQALKLIKKRQGVTTSTPEEQESCLSEEEILKEVMKKSEQEYKESCRKRIKEESDFSKTMEEDISHAVVVDKLERDILKKSDATCMEPNEEYSKEILSEEDDGPAAKPGEMPKDKDDVSTPIETAVGSTLRTDFAELSINKSKPKKCRGAEPKDVRIQEGLGARKRDDVRVEELTSVKRTPKQEASPAETNPSKSNPSSTLDDAKKREEYLKQQRDRLLAMKKKEREKRLANYKQTLPEQTTNAKISQHETQNEGEKVETHDETHNAKQVAMRRALAERLKREVVFK